MHYKFRLATPDDRATIAIAAHDATGLVLTACFTGKRQALSDGMLLRHFLRHPMMAAQVVGGIHWEALKLWRKGMRVQPRPEPPEVPVSIVLPARPT